VQTLTFRAYWCMREDPMLLVVNFRIVYLAVDIK
jgi:hypothetical protein